MESTSIYWSYEWHHCSEEKNIYKNDSRNLSMPPQNWNFMQLSFRPRIYAFGGKGEPTNIKLVV